jgi:condensation domain-containing protein
MPFLYQLSPNHTLSITQLRHALQLVINKHQSLRTSFVFDIDKNLLMQWIIDQEDNKDNLSLITESTYETDEQFNNILHDEQTNRQHFDLSQGRVFRCHIVYCQQISSNDLLSDKDILIFNFHRALFDLPSMDVFLNELNQAYETGHLSTNDDSDLRYLDCKYTYLSYFFFISHHLSLYII